MSRDDSSTGNRDLNRIDWPAYEHYGYAALVAVGTLLAVVAVHWLMARSPWRQWVRSLQGVAPPFTNVIGVLFGLTLAFLANDTWTAHDRAVSTILHEADSIHGLAILSRSLDAREQDEMQAAIVEYAKATVAEWPLLARGQTDPAVGRSGDQLLQLIASRSIAEAAGSTVQQLMLQEAIGVRTSRDLRIGLSQTHVNPLKWFGMAFLGFLTLLSVAVVHADNPRAALVATVLFATAAAPTSAIVLIHGNPFQPPSAVSPAPIAGALSQP